MNQFNKKTFQERKPFKENELLIFGVHAIKEAIAANKEINKILIQKGINKELYNEIVSLTKGKDYFIQYVPIEKINKETRQNHQGIIAFISPIKYYKFEELIDQAVNHEDKKCFLFLDRITDVRNFGAIARTAECMGIDAIVIPSRSSVQVTPDAIKTSSGALNSLPVCKAENIKDSLFYAQQSGFRLIACTEKSSSPLYETNFRGNTVIIMGSEEDGISNDILNMVDVKTKIPMKGKISSLNVGVATGMVLYERLRQHIY